MGCTRLIVIIGMLPAVLVAVGCGSDPSAASTPKAAIAAKPRAGRVMRAEEALVPRTVAGTGTLAAQEQVVLGTKVPGRLAEIAVDLGTRVPKGQVVARLDQSDYKLRVDQAEAALQQARARLGLPVTGTDQRVDPAQTSIVRQAPT